MSPRAQLKTNPHALIVRYLHLHYAIVNDDGTAYSWPKPQAIRRRLAAWRRGIDLLQEGLDHGDAGKVKRGLTDLPDIESDENGDLLAYLRCAADALAYVGKPDAVMVAEVGGAREAQEARHAEEQKQWKEAPKRIAANPVPYLQRLFSVGPHARKDDAMLIAAGGALTDEQRKQLIGEFVAAIGGGE